MINIITSLNDINTKVRKDFDSFFKLNVLSSTFEKLDEEVMLKVDKATLVDKKSGLIKTEFGLTDVLHLSTGCKTVLSYLHIIRNKEKYDFEILDINECGANALEVLFECVDKLNDSDTVFLLEHSNHLFNCSERDYIINGNHSKDLLGGIVKYD